MKEQSDHDLLIRVDQKVDSLSQIVKELKEGTLDRLSILEKDKVDRKQMEEIQENFNIIQNKINNDIETRLRFQEKKTASYKITLTLYSVAVASMIGLIIYHILQT